MVSWKTSLIGLALIIIGVVGMALANLDKVIGGAIITAGLGFLAAKDSQVHGGIVPQGTPLAVEEDSRVMGFRVNPDTPKRTSAWLNREKEKEKEGDDTSAS